MSQSDHTTRALTEAEQLIEAGDFSRAVGKLRTAAQNFDARHADAPELLARIRTAAGTLARDDPRHASEAQAILDVVDGRAAFVAGLRAEASAAILAPSIARGVSGRSQVGEPWFYGAAELVAKVAIVASILSLIAGIVVGAKASAYTTFSDGPMETRHHGGVFLYWIVIGVFAAALWLGVAAGLNLLVDIGRSLRSSRGRS